MPRKRNDFKSKAEYDMNYAKENLKRIPLDIPKEKYEEIRSHAVKYDKSVSGFIKRAISETIERDLSKDKE